MGWPVGHCVGRLVCAWVRGGQKIVWVGATAVLGAEVAGTLLAELIAEVARVARRGGARNLADPEGPPAI